MNTERMILGKEAIYSTDTNETQITNNVAVVGSTGAGKSVSIILPKLLETKESSIICSVSKRKIVDEFIPLFQKRGYQVYDLNFADPRKSDICYDPIRFISSTEDISYLSSALIMGDGRKANSTADPYWDTASINVLNALISMTLLTHKDATMADVLKYIDMLRIRSGSSHIATTLDDVFFEICKKDPTGFCATNWLVFSQLDSTKTASCILSAMQTMTATIFNEGLRRQIATKPCIDLECVGKEKTALFITTSAMNPCSHVFANIFYGQAFKTLFELAQDSPDYRLPVHVSMLFDDFGVGGKVKDFEQYTSIIREANMDYCILLQSETQLAERYGEFAAKTILNNTDSYVFLGCNDYDTARNVSLRADVPVEMVLSLPIGKEIIFRRGSKPIFTQRYPTLEDERYVAYCKTRRTNRRTVQREQ